VRKKPTAQPLESIDIQIDGECDKPTPAHAEFIDSFLLRYPTDLGVKIEPVVNNCALSMDESGKWSGLEIYLPASIETPVCWSLQYSFDSEELDSFGIFIEMEDDEIIDVCGAD
jgi:hypothetical protein